MRQPKVFEIEVRIGSSTWDPWVKAEDFAGTYRNSIRAAKQYVVARNLFHFRIRLNGKIVAQVRRESEANRFEWLAGNANWMEP